MHDDIVEYALQFSPLPIIDDEELKTELQRIITLKRILSRYQTTGKINIRLLLNHVTILLNCFGGKTVNILLFNELSNKFYPVIKPILLTLNVYQPDDLFNADGVINDPYIESELRHIIVSAHIKA